MDKEKLFELMDRADLTMFKGYNIHAEIEREIGFSMHGIRKVWKKTLNDSGNLRTLPDNKANRVKVEAAIKMYQSKLSAAIKEIQLLNLEVTTTPINK